MVELEQDSKGVRNDSTPLVTIAMPVYNAGQYLRLAVLSIVNQTFLNWELLIIDDGSTDNALQSIVDIDDPRIQIFRDGKNRGLAARLNECIDLARGKYFARMDQDDVSYPGRLARQIEALQADDLLDLIAVRAITIDENNAVTGLFPFCLAHKEICARPWMGFYFPHPTWLGRIEWFRKYRYALPGPYFCEDQELLLRSYRESKFATVDEVLFGYRVRGQVNWQKLIKTRRTILAIQLRYFSRSHRWYFAFLAAAVFFARLSSDLIRLLPMSVPGFRRANLDNELISQWNSVLDSLEMEPMAS